MVRKGCSQFARLLVAIATLVALFGAEHLQAQETGGVAGQVTSATSARPLSGAQVSIDDTGIGALTNQEGRFLLLNVPVGTHTVRVTMIGWGTETGEVTVASGETASLNLTLEESAVALDEIVVTGAGVATERRKLGNTISSINSADLSEKPITSMSEVLTGREPGVVAAPLGGLAGQGASIRIRGSASLSQNNEPLIYVDGVRVDNSGGFGPGVSAGGSGTTSRLDDLDPTTIERIEILKGAAAATLYGTEASNGVIQVFTKRGREGEPSYTAQVEFGLSKAPTNRVKPLADFARNQDDVQAIQNFWGVSVAPYEVFERQLLPDFYETGLNTAVSTSVRGGTSSVNYFVSGRYAWEDGVFGQEQLGPARDNNDKAQLTLNLDVFPKDNFRLRFSSFYSEVNHATPNNANNIYAPMEMGFIGQLRLAREGNQYGSPTFATAREGMQVETEQKVQHFAGSVNLNYQFAEGLSVDGTFGLDVVNDRAFENIPFGWNVDNFTTSQIRGARDISDRNNQELTADIKTSWVSDLSDMWSSSLVVGGQGFMGIVNHSGGSGENYPGPGLEVAGAAAAQSLTESYLKVVNAGIFGQEQLGYDDWAFLTVGARYDYNSAFGETAGGAFYPKASVSLVASDALDWQFEQVSTLRLRAAIGRSGLQPGAFDKFTTFSPLPSHLGPGVVPDNLGNEDLKPEVSTEWEVGTEIGFMNDRHQIDVTYWNRTVTDAMVSRQFPVTGGFRAEQLDNIGEMSAQGVEVGVEAGIVRQANFSLDLFANAAYLDEEVTDMGGAPPLKVGGSYPRYRNFIIEGYSPGVFLGAKVQDVPIPLDLQGTCQAPASEAEALDYFSQPRDPFDFEVLPVDCGSPDFLLQRLGKPTPDWQGSFGLNGSLGESWSFNTLFEFKAGDFFVQDLSGAFRKSNSVIGFNTPRSARIKATLINPNSSAEERLEAALQWARTERSLAPMSGMNNVHPADFLRWRELSLTYSVPQSLVQAFAVNSLAVTVSGRNLHLWVNDAYTGIDPEINQNGVGQGCGLGTSASVGCNFTQSIEAWGIPVPRRFQVSIRAGF